MAEANGRTLRELIHDALKHPARKFAMGGAKVVLLHCGILVKYGSVARVNRAEGLAMQLARRHGIAEAPKVSELLALDPARAQRLYFPSFLASASTETELSSS